MKIFTRAAAAVTSAVMAASMCIVDLGSAPTTDAAGRTAIDIVNDMGLGWNLGNTFDSWGTTGWADKSKGYVNNETGWGNAMTTQAMIDGVKNSGFNSVRIPVSWADNVDNSTYDINDKYLARVKEVVDYCYKNDMYVIINMHWDWETGGTGWLNKGMNALPQFKAMWGEIATYFSDYNDHLVFESMNEVQFDYNTLNTFNQSFVDTIRATGGNNKSRLLLCSGANADLEKTCSSQYKVPNDDMVAVDIHYYIPSTFCIAKPGESWGYTDTWGSASDKSALVNNFERMKSTFVDKGIPVILGEYGVCTEKGKKIDCLHDFNKTVASTALSYSGFAAYLWDDSDSGELKYFSRKKLAWNDPDMAKIYSELSGSSYTPPTVDWVETEFGQTMDEKGNLIADTYTVHLGTSHKVKLEFENIPDGISKAMVGYWDNNANDGKGAWEQKEVGLAVIKNEDGEIEINHVDSKDNTVNYGFIELAPDVSTSDIQIQFVWQQNDQAYPTLTKAYITGIVDPSTTTTPPTTTATTSKTTASTTVTTATETTPVETGTAPEVEEGAKAAAYIAGGIGAEECWKLEDVNSISKIASIKGDGQYSVEWNVTKGGTDTVQFLAVIIQPTELLENFTTDSLPELEVTLDEVWVDGVQLTDYTVSDKSINTAYYEGTNPGVSRIYLHNEWGMDINDLAGDQNILEGIKVVFTVKGVDAGYTEETTGGEEEIVYGDANRDGKITIADATAILQSIVNSKKYGLSPEGERNADVDGNKGVTPNDALVIQQVDAGMYKPEDLPLKAE